MCGQMGQKNGGKKNPVFRKASIVLKKFVTYIDLYREGPAEIHTL